MALARRLAAAMCLFAGILISAAAAAADAGEGYTVDSVPNPRLENTAFHVSDPDGLLKKETVSSINDALGALEESTGVQGAVVVLPSISGGDDFEFAQDLFRDWGIGDKEKNDGLLVLYVQDQHVVRIHTGYGIEGPLPDAICKRIEQQDMIPYFKEGKIDEGLKAGVNALCKRLSSGGSAKEQDGGDADAEAAASGDDADSGMSLPAIAATVILIIIFSIGVFVYQRFEKCPHCGKRGTMKVISEEEIETGDHETMVTVRRRCSSCGYVEEKTHTETHGGGDDSSSGGSFSGGSSGGGGSSSRW
ncbi:MAG: TPM domain-containing protein [Succinivibrio sp.]